MTLAGNDRLAARSASRPARPADHAGAVTLCHRTTYKIPGANRVSLAVWHQVCNQVKDGEAARRRHAQTNPQGPGDPGRGALRAISVTDGDSFQIKPADLPSCPGGPGKAEASE